MNVAGFAEAPPEVAILTTLYAGDNLAHAERAIQSLLQQDYTRRLIHLYVYVDGPVPPAHEAFLARHAGSFHRVCRGAENRGLPHGLNTLLRVVGDETYYLRMDLDDVALPQRINRQVGFMEAHPEIDLCGANSQEIDDEGVVIYKRTYPEWHDEIASRLSRCNPMLHPTYCVRARSWRTRPVFYRPLRLNEDLGFIFDAVLAGWRLHNLQDDLLQWRTGRAFFARRGPRRAWVEMTTYIDGIRRMHGWSAELAWPLLRFGLRLLPHALAKRCYASRLRHWAIASGPSPRIPLTPSSPARSERAEYLERGESRDMIAGSSNRAQAGPR